MKSKRNESIARKLTTKKTYLTQKETLEKTKLVFREKDESHRGKKEKRLDRIK